MTTEKTFKQSVYRQINLFMFCDKKIVFDKHVNVWLKD